MLKIIQNWTKSSPHSKNHIENRCVKKGEMLRRISSFSCVHIIAFTIRTCQKIASSHILRPGITYLIHFKAHNHLLNVFTSGVCVCGTPCSRFPCIVEAIGSYSTCHRNPHIGTRRRCPLSDCNHSEARNARMVRDHGAACKNRPDPAKSFIWIHMRVLRLLTDNIIERTNITIRPNSSEFSLNLTRYFHSRLVKLCKLVLDSVTEKCLTTNVLYTLPDNRRTRCVRRSYGRWIPLDKRDRFRRRWVVTVR
jgi:hypothetical protein